MKYRAIHDIARKKVRSKRRFNRHFALYISVMFFLVGINVFNGVWYDGFWAKYPIVSWGAVIMLHYLLTYGFPFSGALSEEWEKEQYNKEFNKLASSDIDGFSDLDIDDRLELQELNRLKAKWEADHFV